MPCGPTDCACFASSRGEQSAI